MPDIKLLCEYASIPIDVQTQCPRFSWMLKDNNVPEQLSYRITVSQDPEFTQLVWDSGTVQSKDSLGIVYNGSPPLRTARSISGGQKSTAGAASAFQAFPTLKLQYPPERSGRVNGFPTPSRWTAIQYCCAGKYAWTVCRKRRAPTSAAWAFTAFI